MEKKRWVSPSGLICKVNWVFNKHWCGYVGVDKTHPLYEVEYCIETPILTEIGEKAMLKPLGDRSIITAFIAAMRPQTGLYRPDEVFDVHGSLTFSRRFKKDEELWWFGFDCAHLDDNPIRCNQQFAEAQCEKLAEQLAEVQKLYNN